MIDGSVDGVTELLESVSIICEKTTQMSSLSHSCAIVIMESRTKFTVKRNLWITPDTQKPRINAVINTLLCAPLIKVLHLMLNACWHGNFVAGLIGFQAGESFDEGVFRGNHKGN